MKKIFLLTAFISAAIFVHAAEIKFETNPDWATVLKKATTEKKLIFLDAYATWCGPCKKMDAEVYTDQAVADFYNANFINVKYDMEAGEGKMLAEKFAVTAYPSLLFVGADGKIVHKALGFKEPDQFVALGKEASNPDTQYATIKAKATSLSPVDFIKFAIQAEAFQDPEYDEVVRTFLTKQTDVLASKELVDIVMKAVTYLPDEKTLAYVVGNKSKIQTVGQYSQEEIAQRMIGLTLAYAVFANTNDQDGTIDAAAVKEVLNKYIPEDAFYVYSYFNVEHNLELNQMEKAVQAFNELLAAPADKLTYQQYCSAIIAFGAALAGDGQLAKTFAALDAYKLKPEMEKEAYLKNLAKAVTYLKLKDTTNFKVYSDALIASKDTPDPIKEQLKAVVAQQQ